jgi:hypothetical protein
MVIPRLLLTSDSTNSMVANVSGGMGPFEAIYASDRGLNIPIAEGYASGVLFQHLAKHLK